MYAIAVIRKTYMEIRVYFDTFTPISYKTYHNNTYYQSPIFNVGRTGKIKTVTGVQYSMYNTCKQ